MAAFPDLFGHVSEEKAKDQEENKEAFSLATRLDERETTVVGSFFKSVDLRETTRLLRRRIKIIARMMALCAALGLLASLILPARYKAETILLLDQRQPKLMEAGALLSGLPGDNASLRSEMDIITSRPVLDRVIKKLGLLDDPDFSLPKASWLQKLFSSSKEEAQTSSEEETERKMTAVARALQDKIDVANDGRSLSIKLTYTARDAHKAAQIANTVADEYLLDQLEAKYEVIARANKWLSERLSTLRKQVETSERAVEAFRQKANLIQIDGGTVATRQMDEVNTQLIAARAQTSQAEARLRNAQSMVQSAGGVEGAADVLSSPLIQKLREQEAELRRKEAEMSTRYGERHPNMINIRAEVSDLERKIGEEVQKILRSLAGEVDVARAKEGQLQKDLNRLEGRAGAELKDSVQLRQLQREADANRTLYENFLTRFKQTSEQQDMQIPDTRVIARADVPEEPFFPQRSLFLLVGALVGGFLGVMAAYLVEFLDRGFRTAPQLEEGTGLSVIGQVPGLAGVTKSSPEAYVLDRPLSAYTESLRTVRTAIHFSNVDHPPRSVMVTSSGPAEGKTTFCLALARVLAAGGNKVLLVDADMRRPRIAKALGLKADGKDLSALLTGLVKIDKVLRADPQVPALHVIPAFGRAPNAQDLLGSNQMRLFMKDVTSRYDLVIVDTPPILAVADAAMIGRVVDTSLFIVKWAETARDTVTQALKQLKTFDCRIAGAVLNQVNLNALASYGEGYYSHRYHAYYTD